ncbi:MAG: pentapeptide repeat-containing protein [Pseudomonadota bacterium]
MASRRRIARARAAARRLPAAPDTREDDTDQRRLDRIEALSRAARANWLGLLAYLVFVGVTLLGVEDRDFFLQRAQTRLPIAQVDIPTFAFFWTSSILGAALHVYLHLYLLKLWDALSPRAAPPRIGGEPLSERAFPWLVNDLALRLRRDGAARPRALNWLATLATILLVWLAAPVLLALAWWRSMPAHEEWMTLGIGACLLLALYASIVSAARLRARMAGDENHGGLRNGVPWAAGFVAAVAVIGLSWSRTEGGDVLTWLDIQMLTVESAEVTFRMAPGALAPIDLREVELVPVPDDWRDWDAARADFRDAWCRQEGIPPQTCGEAGPGARAPAANVKALRLEWCATHHIPHTPAGPCEAFFADRDAAFLKAWRDVERPAARKDLTPLNLRGRDLRGADLFGAFLAEADLREARMEGADLSRARMEGANLRRARMERANLSRARMEGGDLLAARMEGADLSRARMEGTNLVAARMEGAYLKGARMEGANLRGARMEGAVLGGARMEGANLREARMEGAYLFEARMEGVSLTSADLSEAKLANAALRAAEVSEDSGLSPEQAMSAFWDGSVSFPFELPEDLPRWRREVLTDAAWLSRLRGWLEARGVPEHQLHNDLRAVDPTPPDAPLRDEEIAN